MGVDFFKYVFPPLARQHYLNAIALSSWLYLFEEYNPRTVSLAFLLTIHAIKNGIQVYREFSWDDEPEDDALAVLTVNSLKSG